MVNPDGSVENLGDKYGKKTGLSDAALTQEKARQQIRGAAQKHGGWNCRRRKCRKRAERSVRDWRHLTGIITALSSTAIIRSARRADCLPFLAQALSDGKTVALPVTSKERLQRDCGREKRMQDTHRMEFYRIRELSRVREAPFM